MWAFLLRRILQSLLALFSLAVLVFIFTWATGDPVEYMNPIAWEDTTPELLEQLRKSEGLDRPLVVQFFDYIGRILQGDFGYSWRLGRRPVLEIIIDRLPPTLHLGAMATAFTLAVAIPLGVFAAYFRGRVLDLLARTLAFAGQSVPEFWLAMVLVFIFGSQLGWLPIAGREGGWQHWVLPAITAGWASMAGLLRITRSSVLEIIGSDFVRTAYAKGLPGRLVLWRHTFRNALIPIITTVALLVVSMMNGIVLVETVFGWGGIGRLLVTAVQGRDLFLVQGLVLIIGIMFLVANLLADVLYSMVDPRVKLG